VINKAFPFPVGGGGEERGGGGWGGWGAFLDCGTNWNPAVSRRGSPRLLPQQWGHLYFSSAHTLNPLGEQTLPVVPRMVAVDIRLKSSTVKLVPEFAVYAL
jgi:hypothetical protein